ncbi:hypothetical protein RRG08_017019 [Elysia crispata]|uniref:Uncharacterized protein n=1 Tax=Elysia crispata TaxID=231223 RepID=A0AAE0XYY7_9GAST|nr:hypothetical protein RRG08_017019 [Elysia crispata]
MARMYSFFPNKAHNKAGLVATRNLKFLDFDQSLKFVKFVVVGDLINLQISVNSSPQLIKTVDLGRVCSVREQCIITPFSSSCPLWLMYDWMCIDHPTPVNVLWVLGRCPRRPFPRVKPVLWGSGLYFS